MPYFDIVTPGPVYQGREFASLDHAAEWVLSMSPISQRRGYTSRVEKGTVQAGPKATVKVFNSKGALVATYSIVTSRKPRKRLVLTETKAETKARLKRDNIRQDGRNALIIQMKHGGPEWKGNRCPTCPRTLKGEGPRQRHWQQHLDDGLATLGRVRDFRSIGITQR